MFTMACGLEAETVHHDRQHLQVQTEGPVDSIDTGDANTTQTTLGGTATLMAYRRSHNLPDPANSDSTVLLAQGWTDVDEPGSWSIPKTSAIGSEDLLGNALDEFEDTLGVVPVGPFIKLDSATREDGTTQVWAFECRCDSVPDYDLTESERLAVPGLPRAFFFDLEQASKVVDDARRQQLDSLRDWLQRFQRTR
jgi:predicted NUDIX family NTP pyrophosphohydrolase